VSWASKKQNSIALSTAEAEYIAAGHLSAFRDRGGSLSRRVNVATCPSPDGSSARPSAKGGKRGGWRPA
jgi:hypothetical protein